MKKKLFIAFSRTGEHIPADYQLKSIVRAAALATLAREGFPYDAELSVVFCDNEYIHKLNKEYRGVDKHTDVLSFPIYDGEFPEEECRFGATLGDVVISLERAAEQAAELGHSTEREVAFLTAHSVLHLLGYDHERSPEEDEVQCRIQREIVESLGLE